MLYLGSARNWDDPGFFDDCGDRLIVNSHCYALWAGRARNLNGRFPGR